MRAMQEIKAGTFWINDPLTDNDAGPFGGMRWSGIGRELGEEGLDAFREPKHVHLDYVMERKSYWYPYRDRPIPGHAAGACGLGRTPARKVTSDQAVSSHPPPAQSLGSSIPISSASKLPGSYSGAYSHAASGGRLISTLSIRALVRSPNTVPRSCTRLNSTYRPRRASWNRRSRSP